MFDQSFRPPAICMLLLATSECSDVRHKPREQLTADPISDGGSERLGACLVRHDRLGLWEESQWRVRCNTAKRPVQTDTNLAGEWLNWGVPRKTLPIN